jgi:hypothetical protein
MSPTQAGCQHQYYIIYKGKLMSVIKDLSDQETPELTWGGVVSRAWKSGIVWKTGLLRRGSSW